jgi:hypothetical protein
MNVKPSRIIFHVPAATVEQLLSPAAVVDRTAPQPAGTAGRPPQKWRGEIRDGAELWRDLHAFGLSGRLPDAGWWSWFAAQLPCGECRSDWLRMFRDTPPPADPADLFAWTVARHNEVNRRLKKPEMAETAARQVWAGSKSRGPVPAGA